MSFGTFRSISHIGYSTFTDQLESNIVSLLDYGFLCVGGFFTATTGLIAPYGGNFSTLRMSDDFRYTTGTVWEGARSNWVWERNIEYYIQPLTISGIYVNNVFIPNNSGYYIDYPRGRVVFSSPISTTSTVKVEHSYRYYNIYSPNLDWFKQLMENSFRPDNSHFSQHPSGIWSVLTESRAQLPAIFPYVVPRQTWKPKQLGGGSYLFQDVLFYVFAETKTDRDRALDILSAQYENRVFFYDKNLVSSRNAYPLEITGALKSSGAANFIELVNNNLWADAILINTCIEDKNNESAPQLFRGVAKWTMWFDFPS